jgi:hypothetical protein
LGPSGIDIIRAVVLRREGKSNASVNIVLYIFFSNKLWNTILTHYKLLCPVQNTVSFISRVCIYNVERSYGAVGSILCIYIAPNCIVITV